MELKDKQELVRLLNLYQADLIESSHRNEGKHNGLCYGIKSQYEHARIICTKLSHEVGKNLKSYWEL